MPSTQATHENQSTALEDVVVAVYGPRRSGTNYLANLILVNTPCPVALLDAKPGRRAINYPRYRWLFGAHGSKHTLLDRPPGQKYPSGAVCIFVFKPILSWVFSRVAYQRTHTALAAAALPSFVRRVIQSEYLAMLTGLADHLEGPLKDVRVALVNYETMGLDGFERLLTQLGLEHETPIKGFEAEAKPGGGAGEAYVRKGAQQLVPETALHAEILDLCAQALKSSDPRILGLYERIFGGEPVVLAAGQTLASASPVEGSSHLASYWAGRFTVRSEGQFDLVLKDRLKPDARVAPRALFTGLLPRTRDLTYFRYGFVPPVLGAVGATVLAAGNGADDMLVWHATTHTEQDAMAAHAGLVGPLLADGAMHVYLGLPWATWLDRMLRPGRVDNDVALGAIAQQLQLVGVELLGYRHALARLGTQLRVHTVCQHVQGQEMLPAWRDLGVTDLWLSHCPDEGVPGMNVRAWRLLATQVREPGQTAGLQQMADPFRGSDLAQDARS